ncbi:MAG: porin family protein [Gemmatimonadota bacterium]|nr:porin family protein [Gemmatimonadota bacterium]
MLRSLLSGFALLLCLPVIAPAQSLEDYDYENLAFRGIGFEVGQVWPRRSERALTYGLRADLGYLGPNVRIVPGLVFWSSTLRQSDLPALGDIEVSDLALNVDGHYVWDLSGGFTPYAGAGLGIHLFNGEGEAIDGTFVEELLDVITPGLNVVGGAELRVAGPFRLFAEARGVLASPIRSLGLSFGGVWTFPTVPPASRRTSPEDRG